MSVFGVSSYFRWTQKGNTILPLVRGSGFLVEFEQLSAFYHYHVISAAHVSCPVMYKQIYGDSKGLHAIGRRHIYTKLLKPKDNGEITHIVNLAFSQRVFPNADVVTLRCEKEKELVSLLARKAAVEGEGVGDGSTAAAPPASELIQPMLLDLDPIPEGEELVICGMDVVEERANPNDDGLRLTERRIEAQCKAALVTLDYGTVLLAEATQMPSLGMCGGPVLRKKTGGCVGVLVAQARRNAPPRKLDSDELYQDPYLDISENVSLHPLGDLNAAFVPIAEFYQAMRRSEM